MNKTIDNAVKFREVQLFRQKWLWIGLAVVSLCRPPLDDPRGFMNKS